MMSPQWRLRPVDEVAVDALREEIDISPTVVRLLVQRGVSDYQGANRFLEPRLAHLPDPGAMAGLAIAVERLDRAICDREKIAVFGDYDADGVTSAAIIGDYLRRAGEASIDIQVAKRGDGYGFSRDRALALVDQSVDVVVLTDCGTHDEEAVRILSEGGIDVIAIDHHRGAAEDWPGLALLNPHRESCGFEEKGLCSAGLAFYVAAALRTIRTKRGELAPDPRDFLDLVAIGTIADVAALDGANRALVSSGLRVISRRKRPGLRELIRLSKLSGKGPVTAKDISWRIAPRLNAPGRLGDASVALECLIAASSADAQAYAARCEELNRERREIQNRVLDEAISQAENLGKTGFCLVAAEGWHPGVVGIVAARLAELKGVPAAVVALDGDIGRGSARSIPGIDLFSILHHAKDHLLRFGGHHAAAGFSVARKALPQLMSVLDVAASDARADLPLPSVEIDALVSLSTVDEVLVNDLQRLAPHGPEQEEPLLGAGCVEVKSQREMGKGHLLLTVSQGAAVFKAVGFGMYARRPSVSDKIDIAFIPEIDTYQGGVRLRLGAFSPAGEGITADLLPPART